MKQRPALLITRRIFPEVVARLREHFEVQTNEADAVWSRDELIARLQGKAGVFVTTSEPIDAGLLAACPELRAVCSMAVGYNNIDVAACRARGVMVTHAPDVLTETTADFGFALLLAAARRVGEAERLLRRGEWTKWSVDFMAGADVHGATLGILGMGRIGQAIARRGALGFGMKVIYHNRSRLSQDTEAALGGAERVELDALLERSDHLMIVVPYGPATHHVIGAAQLARMRRGAVLVNIARGGVVDDAALAMALRSGHIGAAGLDVFEGEPAVHPALLDLPNTVLTPHIASASEPTRRAMANLAADNLIGLLATGQGAKTPVPEMRG